MKKYNGIYADYIRQFIEFKRSLGYKFQVVEYIYLMFDRFTIEQGEVKVGITKELAEEWNKKRPNESGRNQYLRINCISQLATFLCEIGHPSHISRLPKVNTDHVPYIFSAEQIKLLFDSCDKVSLRQKQFNTSLVAVPALFRLLYGTGLRLCEALGLKNAHVNLKDEWLVIKSAKNGQDRIIPLSVSLAQVCRDYIERRELQMGKSNKDNYFFGRHDGGICSRRTAYKWFRKILQGAGIAHLGRGQGPRAHDLRHSFCVHSLVAMSGSGLDMYYSLPILSTYLGHRSLEATDKYVRLTAEMYPGILRDINNISNYVFPKTRYHETN
jgi:integrase